MYLFLRGMCGPETPVVDGHPAGVFSWRPPASLIAAMSDLVRAGSRVTAMEWRQARGATGLLLAFSEAEVLESSDVHVAQRLTTLAKEPDETVALAVALAVRALRNGSVCVDLRSVEKQVGVDGLPWPDVDGWLAAVQASTLAGTPPTLRLDGDLLYLDRYWLEEQQVADDVHTMIAVKPEKVSPDIDRLFPAGFEEQRAAAKVALSQGLTVLTGGPGTGKTTTVARLLALLAAGTRLRVALAAPTGKAAARLQEAVQLEVGKLDKADREALSGMHATTLHRLLGSRPDTSARFRHNRGNRLPHDVIVVDETSMVSLTMMARLLEAVRPDARLILVGDPDQLASVEAGAVLADLVDGLGDVEARLAEDATPVRRIDRSAGVGDQRAAMRTKRSRCCGPAASTSSGSTPTRRRSICAKCLCRRRADCARRRSWTTPRRRCGRWTSIGCCVRIAGARMAFGSGTVRSSGGWRRRRVSRSGRRGTRADRCW